VLLTRKFVDVVLFTSTLHTDKLHAWECRDRSTLRLPGHNLTT
jgi:hypothetical protein